MDTADIYAGGTSEPLVGELVSSARDRIVLATKFGLSTHDDDVTASGSSYRTMVRAVERSLRRLGTDRIDLLWLHAWDGITPLPEVARGLDALVQSGKVLYVGISDTPAWAIALLHSVRVAQGFAPITAVQLRYSVLDRAVELEFLPMTRHLGIGVAAFGVISGGVLSGKYHAATASGRRGASTLQAREQTVVDVVQSVARHRGCTPTQVAISWLRHRDQDIMAIVGARTPSQLDDALGALDVELDADDITVLDAAAPPPRLFPHDVIDAVKQQLRGGKHSSSLDLPPEAAF